MRNKGGLLHVSFVAPLSRAIKIEFYTLHKMNGFDAKFCKKHHFPIFIYSWQSANHIDHNEMKFNKIRDMKFNNIRSLLDISGTLLYISCPISMKICKFLLPIYSYA